MSNITITDNDAGHIVLDDKGWEDGLLTFGGAGTVKKGTILARHGGTLKFIPYVKGGTDNANGVPRAVVTHDVEAEGAGDVPVRVLAAGTVNQRRLVIHADGDAENIDGAVRDLLRATGIIPQDVEQLAREDNPQSELGDT